MVRRKAWEIFLKMYRYMSWIFHKMKRAKDIRAWAEEIETFKNVVEKFTGNEVTAEKLAEKHYIN